MFRRFFSSSVLLSAAPVAQAAQNPQNETSKQAIFRPQELPIYKTILEGDIKT